MLSGCARLSMSLLNQIFQPYCEGRTLNNNLYNTGTKSKVITVANSSPIIMAIAMGSHIKPPPRYKGIKPRTVVKVVSSIGRKRCCAALTID